MSKLIYLDNAATTKTAPEVVDAMLPYFSEFYGNPSSIYDFAQKSKEAVTKGRQQIADVLNAKKEEIDNIRISINSLKYLEAPVEENTKIGKVTLQIGDSNVESIDIITKNIVNKKSAFIENAIF